MSQQRTKKMTSPSNFDNRYALVEKEKARIKHQLMQSLGIDKKDEAILRLVLNDILRGF